jgi:hypothetical protein
VHEWNRVHRPNFWIEFLSAPIHSPPPFWFAVSVLLQSPLDEFIDNTHIWITKEKRKENKQPKETSTSDRKTKGRQRTRSLEEGQVSVPLGKGNGSTQPRQNKLKKRAWTTKPKLENHKKLPLHTCKFPLSQSTPPLSQCSNATWECK